MVVGKSNNFGIASLVLGIISVVFCWVPILGLVSGIIGLVFYSKQKRSYPNGIATAGLVTSIVGLVLSVIYTVFWIIYGAFIASLV